LKNFKFFNIPSFLSLFTFLHFDKNLAALSIAALIISSQVIKAALANPAESLKYE